MIEANSLTLPTRKPLKSKTPKRIGMLLLLLIIGVSSYIYKDDIRSYFFEPITSKPSVQKSSDFAEPTIQESSGGNLSTPKLIGQTTPIKDDLDTSDLTVEEEISSQFNTPLWLEWFGGKHIIRKTVAFIDNASRGDIARKVLSLPVPNQSLGLSKNEQSRYLNDNDFAQYDKYINLVKALDLDVVQRMFVQFKPMLEQAYAELGNPNKTFDQALSDSFELMLDTPDINTPLMIQRIEGRTMFTDDDLENLKDVQKLLIRIGPKNRAAIKDRIEMLKVTLH